MGSLYLCFYFVLSFYWNPPSPVYWKNSQGRARPSYTLALLPTSCQKSDIKRVFDYHRSHDISRAFSLRELQNGVLTFSHRQQSIRLESHRFCSFVGFVVNLYRPFRCFFFRYWNGCLLMGLISPAWETQFWPHNICIALGGMELLPGFRN